VGETFAGTISGVASFGLFVTLDGLNIDGLVHVTELGRDYFHFDQVRHALIGERSGRVFQLAGRVTVTIARVDLERAKIDFTLAQDAPANAPAVGGGAAHPIFAEPLGPETLRERNARGSAAAREPGRGRTRTEDDNRERRSPRGKRRR